MLTPPVLRPSLSFDAMDNHVENQSQIASGMFQGV